MGEDRAMVCSVVARVLELDKGSEGCSITGCASGILGASETGG